MIIWTEKQWKRYQEQTGKVEPAKSEPEPVEAKPAVPFMAITKPVRSEPSPVNNWTKPVFMVCLTVVAVVGMVHEKPSNATVPVKVEQVVKPVHKIKMHHHKKVVDKPFKKRIIAKSDTPDIEEIERRLTTVEERLDDYDRASFPVS